MKTIFVQIASYRDEELVPTLLDCMAKAARPERLSFGVCRQYHPDDGFDDLGAFSGDSRFRIEDVLYSDSISLCWARSRTQALYGGEDYTLQIDSHHRFVDGWDDLLVAMIEKLPGKPILTGYAEVYKPGETLKSCSVSRLSPKGFTSRSTIEFGVHRIKDATEPIPARFISGHFFFTLGRHCLEYRYDPNLYFWGDELTLSARSFTLGYDLYHPHIGVTYHHYKRPDSIKSWSDPAPGSQRDVWRRVNRTSVQRIEQMLGMEEHGIFLGPHGLGAVRTLEDYERYSGINFSARTITDPSLNPPVRPAVRPESKSVDRPGYHSKWPVQQMLDDLRCCFVHVPKTGGISVETALRGGRQKRTGHMAASAYKYHYPEKWGTYYTFAFVRDPVERFLSFYRFRIGLPVDWGNGGELIHKHRDVNGFAEYVLENFDELCKTQMLEVRPQNWFVTDGEGKLIVDDLFHFDDLYQAWDTICVYLGIECDLPHVNKSRGAIKEPLSDDLTVAIRGLYAVDDELCRHARKRFVNCITTGKPLTKKAGQTFAILGPEGVINR